MTFDEARDEVLDVFRRAWSPRAAVYEDTPAAKVPDTNTLWARATLRHVGGGQGSLTGGLGTVRWQRSGLIWIQLFAPIADGRVAGYDAAQELVNAYQSARGAVWYRRAHMVEGGQDGAFQRFDVKVDFEYEDVR